VRHVSGYALASLETAIAKYGCKTYRPWGISPLQRRLLKLAYLAGCVRSLAQQEDRAVIVPMMGLQESLLVPWAYAHQVIPIIFDCVPKDFATWVALFQRCRIRRAFFTAKTVVEHFKLMLPDGEWVWLPEAIECEHYSAAVPWNDRRIDVLEFGRKFDRFHDAIEAGLRDQGYKHVYAKVEGKLVFVGRSEFVRGLADSKISICFPQSMTHPSRFGHVETMTQRYLESMASGAVVLGATPPELATLFGYDPVLAVDWSNPVGQINAILANPQAHEDLRARNLSAVASIGSWTARSRQFAEVLDGWGYGLGATVAELWSDDLGRIHATLPSPVVRDDSSL
jgi:hypothetical protein